MYTGVDWSLAPPGTCWWSMGMHGQAHWFMPSEAASAIDFWYAFPAPAFDYQGDWRESLTERPWWRI